MDQNADIDPQSERTGAKRRRRRLRALHKVAGRRALALRTPLKSAALLALVGTVLFSPLLLDDLMFRTSYLLQPSEDAINITSPTALSRAPVVELTGGTLSVPPALSGKARTGEALAALVKGGSARLALKSPIFVIDLAAATGRLVPVAAPVPTSAPVLGLPGATMEALSSPLLDALRGAAFETLMIRNGTVVLELGQGRREELTALDAEVTIKRRSAVRFKGSMTVRGETVRFDVVAGARQEQRGSSRLPLSGTIESGLFYAAIDGRLELDRGASLTGATADITIPNLRSVARWLGHAWPSGSGLKDFNARGVLDWTGPTLSVSRGRYRLDGNEATGTLSLSVASDRPMIAGTLAFGAFDMTPLIQRDDLASDGARSGGAGAKGAASGGPARSLLAAVKSATDLRWPLIGIVDVDMRLSAEQVKAGPYEAGRAAASLSMRDGQLLFNLAEVLLPDGAHGRGEFNITGSPSLPNFALRGRVEDVELGNVAGIVAGQTFVRGRGHVVFDLATSGSAGADVVQRLSGKLETRFDNGATISCSHKSIAAAARANRSAADLCAASASIGPATLSAEIARGRLRTEKVEVTSGDELVRLVGNYDLTTAGIDIAITSGPALPAGAAHPDREVILVRGRPEALSLSITP